MKFWEAFVYILFLACPCLSQTPQVTEMEAPPSRRFFVQDFYDWYVPRFWKSSPKPAVAIALKNRASVFTPELAQALDNYSTIYAKGRRASADYQYDPFLNAGDACERSRSCGKTPRKPPPRRTPMGRTLGGVRGCTSTCRP